MLATLAFLGACDLPFIEDTDDENRFLMSDDGDQDDEGTLQSPASLDPAAEPELEDGEDESEAI